MATLAAKTRHKAATPTLEQFQSLLQTITTVTTAATPLPATNLSYRKGMIIQNIDSTATIYIGSSTVTADEAATGGIQLGPKDSIEVTLDGSGIIYGIIASSTGKIVTLEFA